MCIRDSNQSINNHIESIFIIPLPKLPEINLSMTQSTMLQLMLLHLTVIHLMATCLATIVTTSQNRFATHHTCREVTTATSTDSVVLAYRLLACTSRTLHSLARCLLGRVLGKDTYSNIDVSLTLFSCSHALQFDKSS